MRARVVRNPIIGALALVLWTGALWTSSAALFPAPARTQSIERSMPLGIPHRGECIKLTKQLMRYAGDLEMARDRGNPLWEEATNQQIARLAHRRARLCPSIVAQEDPVWRRLGNILGIAAQVAIKYFTWGAL